MKYKVLARQPYSVLERADEVIVSYNDIDRVIDFMTKIPDKTVYLQIPTAEAINEKIKAFNEIFDTFILIVSGITEGITCAELGYKWMVGWPISDYSNLRKLANAGAYAVLIDGELCFDLPKVKEIAGNMKIQMVANWNPDMRFMTNKMTGACDPWVRPEDVSHYEPYVDSFEFRSKSLSEEEHFLKIYKENKVWPGNLNLLFTNFGTNVDNRGLREDIGKRRTNCRQVCARTGNCHYCENSIKFARLLDPTIKKKI